MSRSSFMALLFVMSVHASILAAVFLSAPQKIVQAPLPVIQGIMLAAPDIAVDKPMRPEIEIKPKLKLKPEIKPKLELAPPKKSLPVEKVSLQPSDNSENIKTQESIAVVPPRTSADFYNNPAPSYPRLSRRLHEQGTVILELLILADGSVAEITVQTSSGYSRLDEAAIKAVRQWQYIAASENGKHISYRYLQPIEFVLKKE